MNAKHIPAQHPGPSGRLAARYSPVSVAVLLLVLHGGAFAQSAPAQSAAGAAADAGTLPEVSVTAEGEAGGVYQRKRTRGATRTDTPVKEIPQSVSVIPQEVIEDTGDNTIYTALDLGGVGRSNYFAGGMDTFTLRGFKSGEYYRNGMAQGSVYGGVPDGAGLDSIDVVRGPASVTFGSSDPGGTFNIVTKQPQPDAAYGLGLTLDSHGGRRGTADLTGPLNDTGTLLYRLNVAIDGGKTFRDHVNIKREYLAPRLSWQLAPQTKLMLDVDYLRVRSPLDRGVPIQPNLLYGPPDVSTFNGEPGAGNIDNKNVTTQLRLEHALSDDWNLDVGLQRVVGSLYGGAVQMGTLQADQRTVTRSYQLRDFHNNSNLAQAFVRGKARFAGMEHQILAGLEYAETESRTLFLRPINGAAYTFPIDVYDPVYGAAIPTRSELTGAPSNGNSHKRALVVQDQIRVTPRLSALVGLRMDKYDNSSINSTTGAKTTYKKDALTPTLGLSYAFNDAITGYVTHGRSFKPNSGFDVNGNTFKPEQGRSWEVGLKTDLLDQRLQMTTALFNIVKNNVLTTDPDNTDYSITAGQVRSRGLDVSLAGRLGPRTRVVGYAAFLDAEVTKDSTLLPGARLADVPRRRFNLMAVHGFSGALQGLELGANLQYVGERRTASTTNALSLASYTTVDLMANYQISRNVKLKAMLKNVFDRVYYTSSHSNHGYPGAPRTFQVSLDLAL